MRTAKRRRRVARVRVNSNLLLLLFLYRSRPRLGGVKRIIEKTILPATIILLLYTLMYSQ